MTSSEEEKQRRIAELSEEIDTIDAAALTAGEEERLMERRKVIMHAQGILDGLTAAHQALSGDDSGEMMGAADLLGSVVNELAESARLDESLAPLSERLSDLYYGARELATDLADRLDGYDFDPGELDQIEERLDQIYRMKQRYGASVEELLTRRDKAAEELEGYQSSGKRIAELTQRKQELYRQTKAAAETLTQARLKAFTSMNRQMREALEFLNMPGVRMVLRHQRGPLASAGQDNIEFLISTNPGEEPSRWLKSLPAASFPVSCWRSRAPWLIKMRFRPLFMMRSTPVFRALPPAHWPKAEADRQRPSGAVHHPYPTDRCLCR